MLCLNGDPVRCGANQVRSIVGVTGDQVIVTAWTDPTEIHVLSVFLDGSGPVALTSTPGVHGAVSKGGTTVVTSSLPDQPRPTVKALVANEPAAAIEHRGAIPVLDAHPRFLKLGRRSLASALFLPSDHDGESRLPVLLDPYGGPHAQRVLKAQLPHLTSQWFANQGFAVLVVDNRGAPGRGPAFEREVWGDLAGPVLEDQLDALDAAGDVIDYTITVENTGNQSLTGVTVSDPLLRFNPV